MKTSRKQILKYLLWCTLFLLWLAIYTDYQESFSWAILCGIWTVWTGGILFFKDNKKL